MPPRSEPLLWVQLIGVGVMPLEGLLLLLVLAGSDPGPVPGLERLLCWALGGLAPTLLLWHRPADVWSLLLLQSPLRARRPLQQRLSRLQEDRLLRLGLVVAGIVSLPALWWLDDHAAVASSLSPLAGSPRLVVLLLAAGVLALMLWQWQQLLQALWLLSRSPEVVAAARPMVQSELEDRRLCLGLPLLLLEPLQWVVVAPAVPSAAAARDGIPERPPEPASGAVTDAEQSRDAPAAAASWSHSPTAEVPLEPGEEVPAEPADGLAAEHDRAPAGEPDADPIPEPSLDLPRAVAEPEGDAVSAPPIEEPPEEPASDQAEQPEMPSDFPQIS